MPRLNVYSWAIWMATLAMQPILAFWMARGGGLWRKWPSVFSFLCFKSLLDCPLLVITLLPIGDVKVEIYFDTYWIGAGISALIQVWMIVMIASSLAGISRRLRTCISIFIPLMAALHLASALRLASTAEAPHLVISLDRAVSLAWLTVFLCMAFTADVVLGIRWTAQQVGIGTGFAVMAAGEVCASWLIGYLPNLTALSNAYGSIYLGALTAWAVTFWRSSEEPGNSPVTIENLATTLKTFSIVINKLRSK